MLRPRRSTRTFGAGIMAALSAALVITGVVLLVGYARAQSSPGVGAGTPQAGFGTSGIGGGNEAAAPGATGGGTHLEPGPVTASQPVTPAGTTSASVPAGVAQSPGPCSAQMVAIQVGVDSTSYRRGQPVRYVATVRNDGTVACDPGGPTEATTRDSQGAVVLAEPISGVTYGLVDPGQSVSYVHTWNQQACSSGSCHQAAAGSYTIEVTWGTLGTARSAAFSVGS